jgi:hypothetical protein
MWAITAFVLRKKIDNALRNSVCNEEEEKRSGNSSVAL